MRYQSMHFGKKKNRISLIHMNKPLKGGLAGMVSSSIFNENIAIIVDETPEELRDYDFACLACGENGAAPRVMMTREIYYDIKRGKPYARMILFHELGHYYNKDLSTHNPDRDAERVKLTSEGTVSNEEIKADAFAVDFLGASCVIVGLEKLKTLVADLYSTTIEKEIGLVTAELDNRANILRQNLS